MKWKYVQISYSNHREQKSRHENFPTFSSECMNGIGVAEKEMAALEW